MCGMGRTGHLFACDAGRRRRPTSSDHRQGPRRRLPADRRRCSAPRRSTTPSPPGPAPSSTATPTPAIRWRGRRAGGAAGDPRPRAGGAGAERGGLAVGGLGERFGQHPHVGDIRGRGLFLGAGARRRPRDQDPVRPGTRLAAARQGRGGFDEGLICYPMAGTARRPRAATTCCWRRPTSSSEAEIADIVARLGLAIDRALVAGLKPMDTAFDYIVVGAGTAGCLLANRLSADPARAGAAASRPAVGQLSLDPHPGRLSLLHRQPAHRLDVSDRARPGPERPPPALSARQAARRLLVDQRHDLHARPGARLRRAGPS